MTRIVPGFQITGDKGFHVRFPNGYTVSVQFGPGNYCDNHDKDFGKAPVGGWSSRTAETAVWGPDGTMLELKGEEDTVQGYRTPAQVLDLLKWAARQKVRDA